MECLDREPQPTRQASSTALVETASGQNDQKPRKRDVSATNEQPCDAHGTGTGRAPRTALRPPLGPHDAADDDAFARRGLSVVDLGLGTSFLAFDENASVEPSNGAQLTKKLCLRAPGDEPGLAASALAGGLVFRDPGRSLQNNNAGWRMLLPGVERAAPEQAPRLEWRRFFPLLRVTPENDGDGVICLPLKEASPLAQLLLQSNLLKGCDRNLIEYTSSLAVTVVGEAQQFILKCGYVWSSEMQQQLQTPLDSSAKVQYALRCATVALNYVVRQVLLYLAPKTAPLDILADSDSSIIVLQQETYVIATIN